MTPELATHHAIKHVQWRDLVALTTTEKLIELTISVPWLAASLACYWAGGFWIIPGALGTFFFFLTGLRQSHNAQHYAMGIGRIAQDIVMLALSVVMMMSMHAVQVTHLIHHRHCLDDHDIEAGHVAHPWWRVLLQGPLFPCRVIGAALRRGNRQKRFWIIAELLLMATWFILVVFILHIPALQWHLAAVMTGECFTAFFAVWTVHHGCDPVHTIARTQRGWLKNFVSYSMFYHLEHHLFPAVPTGHLHTLAARLDQVNPRFRQRQVW
jgi:fatty acid desaturase